MAASGVTPVTVLTGFLGSGKTTLLNMLLADPRYADTAVVVNEWGEIPIDHALVRTGSENVVALPSGCICCRVADELVGTLRELHFQRAAGTVPAFRRAVIETSGLADPAPLLASLAQLPALSARYCLAGVVTTIDGELGMAQLDEFPEAVKQAAIADRLVVTKEDRASPDALRAIEERLAALNPGATLLRTGRSAPDPAALLEAGLHALPARVGDAAGWLNAGAYRLPRNGAGARHDARIGSFVRTCEEPVPWPEFEAALGALLERLGGRILRLKGLVNSRGESGPRVVHAVQHTLYPSAHLDRWPDADQRTRLVFIARDLEPASIDPIFQSFRAHDPRPPCKPATTKT